MNLDIDYYELLEVERTADEKTLKTAYRRIAMECHPDRNPGCDQSEAKFKAISHAYDVLKDPQKRAAYDRLGKAAFENGGMVAAAKAAQALGISPTYSRAFLAMPLVDASVGLHAGQTCATTLKFHSTKLSMAKTPRLPLTSQRRAAHVKALARRRGPANAAATCVQVTAKCARSKAFSL